MKTINVDGRIIKMRNFDEAFGKYFKSKKFVELYSEEVARLALVRQIRTMRQEQHLTQKALAQRTKMPQSTIARIESGKHSFSLGTLYAIAKAFNKQILLV